MRLRVCASSYASVRPGFMTELLTVTSRKRRTRSILLLVFGLLFSIAAAEFVFRTVFNEQEVTGDYWARGAFEADSEVGYHHTPGYKGYAFRPRAFRTYVEISKQGLRQKDLQKELLFPTKILMLGDSYTLGLGVPEESNFISLLRARVNAFDAGIINGAQSGYCVEQEVKFGSRLVQRFNPQVVVLFLYPENDIQGDYLGDYKNVEVLDGLRLSKNRFLPILPIDFLRTHSYLWLYLDNGNKRLRSDEVRADFTHLAIENIETVLQPTLKALKWFRDKCDSRSITFAIVLIPSKDQSNYLSSKLKERLVADRFQVFDLRDRKFDETDYFRFDGHWNEKGHRKAANAVLNFVRNRIPKH
jgi:lysophospholipase L1-like esterase